MPEVGERALVVVPGGAEVGTSAIGRVQTPSRLGGLGGWAQKDGVTHMCTCTHTHTHRRGTKGQWYKCSEENGLKYVRNCDIDRALGRIAPAGSRTGDHHGHVGTDCSQKYSLHSPRL